MKARVAIAVCLMLAGCQSWDWQAAGRSLLYSACYTIGNCSAPCSSGEEDPTAQCR